MTKLCSSHNLELALSPSNFNLKFNYKGIILRRETISHDLTYDVFQLNQLKKNPLFDVIDIYIYIYIYIYKYI